MPMPSADFCDAQPEGLQVAEPLFSDFAGVTFRPGEYLLADSDGIVTASALPK